jgi:hypothetical protein
MKICESQRSHHQLHRRLLLPFALLANMNLIPSSCSVTFEQESFLSVVSAVVLLRLSLANSYASLPSHASSIRGVVLPLPIAIVIDRGAVIVKI